MAKSHADNSNENFSILADERLTSSVQDKRFDTVVSQSSSFFSRYEILKRQIAAEDKDIVTSIYIDTITSGHRENKEDK